MIYSRILIATIMLLLQQEPVSAQKINRIDKIKEVYEAEEFLEWYNGKLFKEYYIDESRFYLHISDSFSSLKADKEAALETRRIADSLGAKPFYRIDFDGNGKTDLVFGGVMPGVLLNFGRHCHRLFPLEAGHHNYLKVIEEKKQPLLVNFIVPADYRSEASQGMKADTLEFRTNRIVDRRMPYRMRIEQIRYLNEGCYWNCPVYELTIDSSGYATFFAGKYNRRHEGDSAMVEGTYHCRLPRKLQQRITDRLLDLSFPFLDDSYYTSVTDHVSVMLEITYNSGQVKRIQDYAHSGPRGLEDLLTELGMLRWRKGWVRE